MGKVTMLTILVLAFAGGAWAQRGAGESQAAIFGRVYDAALDQPVEFANVVLYSLAESTQVTGTVTDKTGAFLLGDVKPGRYYLELSFMGFHTRTVDNIECAAGARLDVGRIDLEQKPLPVEGVEATAEKPAVSYQIDKKVVDVSKLPNAQSGTAVDALRNVPSVKVDIEDNVTVRGSSNFKVLIDGKPTPLDANEALKQTPAQTIDKIEIITNPSAKYEPDGTAGIINLLLKKQKGSGVSALANANANHRGGFGGDGLLSFRRGIVNVYGGANVGRHTSGWTVKGESRNFGAAETLSIARTGSGNWGGMGEGVRAGLDLTLGPHDKSSASGRVGKWDGANHRTFDMTERYLPGDSTRLYRADARWRFGRRFFFANADHEHTFDTTGHKVSLSAFIVGSDGSSASENLEMAAAGSDTTGGRRSSELGPWHRGDLKLGYALPTRGQDKLEAGFESRLEGSEQDYQVANYDSSAGSWQPDERSSHPYEGSQTVHSLYATYAWNWRGLGVQPGLRGEYGERAIHVIDTDSLWQASRWDYFPTLHMTYSLASGQQVTASYSRRIDRPDAWYLRPFPVWFDAHNVSVGNPELRPSHSNSWELGVELPFGQNSVGAEGYYRTTSDVVEQVTTKYPQDTTVLMQTSQNVGKDRSIGVELTANASPVKWLSVYVTGDVSDYREWGTLFGQDFSKRIFYWTSSANLTLRLPTNTSIQLDGNFSGPSITATSTDDGWFGANLAVKQTMLNRALSVTLRLSNLFGARTWNARSEGPGFASHVSRTFDGLTFGLAVSYNLNNFRFDPKMRAGEGLENTGGGGGGPGQ